MASTIYCTWLQRRLAFLQPGKLKNENTMYFLWKDLSLVNLFYHLCNNGVEAILLMKCTCIQIYLVYFIMRVSFVCLVLFKKILRYLLDSSSLSWRSPCEVFALFIIVANDDGESEIPKLHLFLFFLIYLYRLRVSITFAILHLIVINLFSWVI